MIPVSEAFASSYKKARQNFQRAAKKTGLPVRSYSHNINGLEGEELAIDVVYDGYPDAKQVLVISSGFGGIDGLAGSGIQTFSLRDAELRQKARANGVALLLVHMANPYGCSYISRLDELGINVQRNFVDFDKPLPVNTSYGLLHEHAIPREWPPTDDNVAVMQVMLKKLGTSIERVLYSGQHEFPNGMFYGGLRATWTNRTMQTVFSDYLFGKDKVAWVDLHVTTQGSYGVGERVFSGVNDASSYETARHWWGQGSPAQLSSRFDNTGSVYPHTGSQFNLLDTHCNAPEKLALSIEFGLRPPYLAYEAVRADQWLRAHPEVSREDQQKMKDRLRWVFYSSSVEWQTMLVSQSRDVFFDALNGMAERVQLQTA